MNRKASRKAEKALLKALKTPADRNTEIKRAPLRAAFIALFFVLFGGLASLTAGAANADTTAPTNSSTDNCVTTGSASNTEVKMEACSYSEASRSIDVTLQDRATASGQIQLSYFNPNARGWSLNAAKKCKLVYVSITWSKTKIKRVVNANKRKVNGTWCIRLKHGSTWANSGKNGNLTVPFKATVRGSWSLMTLKNVRKGIWGHKGEYRGGRFWQVCDNEWKIGLRPTLTDTQVLMVRSEADVVYRNKAELVTNGQVKVEGSLKCPAGTLYGLATAAASARDYLWIYVRASSAATAKIEAARRASANTAAWASLHVKAQQSQEVSAHAKIHLECDNTPAVAAPQVTPPTVNDVVVNNTRLVTFTGKLAKGLSGFASASAGTGVILGDNRVALVVDADGYFSVTFTYKAGSEPGTDTVTLIVDQSDGQSVTVKTKGRDASGQEVDYFQIRAVPPENE